MLAAFKTLYRTCRQAGAPPLATLLTFYWRKRHGVSLLAHPNTEVRQIKNLTTRNGVLNVGVSPVGFTVNSDVSLLNVNGQLLTLGDVSIGKGCRLDIGANARVEIGANTYITANSLFIIQHGLRIGAHCAISWGCQFLDTDFHQIRYANKPARAIGAAITVGDHVWIGNGVTVLKGAVIPSGCVVASGSLVTEAFTEENTLLAGRPAKIIRHNVSWE